MATKLNQIIAVEKGVKSKSLQDLTEAHHAVQKPSLLSGISRVYQPKDEEGEQLPPESTKVQVKSEEVLRDMAATITRLLDVTATKDWANCHATADVTVDGQVLLRDVPVTYLLFLEKQLTDLHTFVKKLPVLDAAESWTFDAPADCYRTEAVRTIRTKKVPRNHVKAEATEHHPAQVEVLFTTIWSMVTKTAGSGGKPIDIYARVSRLKRDEKRVPSTDGQAAVCRIRLVDLDLPVGETLVDPGRSAWNPHVRREAWDELMGRLESGISGGVIVFDLERFSRQPKDAERMIELAARGLLVLDSESEYDLTTPNGKKAFRDAINAAAY
jgi:hypothetical protein